MSLIDCMSRDSLSLGNDKIMIGVLISRGVVEFINKALFMPKITGLYTKRR